MWEKQVLLSVSVCEGEQGEQREPGRWGRRAWEGRAPGHVDDYVELHADQLPSSWLPQGLISLASSLAASAALEPSTNAPGETAHRPELLWDREAVAIVTLSTKVISTLMCLVADT